MMAAAEGTFDAPAAQATDYTNVEQFAPQPDGAPPAVPTIGFGDPPPDILAQVATVGQALALAGMAPMQTDEPSFPGAVVTSLLSHLGCCFYIVFL